ncbi:hypothetical protein VTO42DRAFT_2659 [Malbranchea cinnamomea]
MAGKNLVQWGVPLKSGLIRRIPYPILAILLLCRHDRGSTSVISTGTHTSSNGINDREDSLNILARQNPLISEPLEQPRDPSLTVFFGQCTIRRRRRGLQFCKMAKGTSLLLGQHGDRVGILEQAGFQRIDVVSVLVVHVEEVAPDAVDGAIVALFSGHKEGPQVWFRLRLVLTDEDEGELLGGINRDPFFRAFDAVKGGFGRVLGRGLFPATIDGEIVVFRGRLHCSRGARGSGRVGDDDEVGSVIRSDGRSVPNSGSKRVTVERR